MQLKCFTFVEIFILVSLFGGTWSDEHIFIQTSTAGNIKGKISSVNGKNYSVFLGIPFAKPPVDNLRFKDPEPIGPIDASTIVDASGTFSKMCIQVAGYSADSQSEDCLYLNVMSPKSQANDEIKYPVMVFIHGGGFVAGSASLYHGDGPLRNIVSRGVVLVTMNYRLGVFGFFTTKSSIAPGNYGMMDQVEALKWVQKNINYFGGDPKRVTVSGESAGGASVSLLTISPLTKGLFQQAIIMSGSALAPWVLKYDADPNDPSGQLLVHTGCRKKSQNPTINATCPLRLRQAPAPTADELLEEEKEVECLKSKFNDITSMKAFMYNAIMRPRIDGKFLPDLPEMLIKKRPPYNILLGTTKHEFATFEFGPFPGFSNGLVISDAGFYTDSFGISCTNFKYPGLVNFTSHYHYANFPSLASSGLDERNYWFQQDAQPQSAQLFVVPAYKEALEALRTKSKVYVYSWDYEDAAEVYDNNTDFYWKGAAHGSELFPLFDMGFSTFTVNVDPPRRNTTLFRKAAEVLGELWTNFSIFGNPTPNSTTSDGVEWKPLNEQDGNYMSIEIPDIKMKNNFHKDDIQFWLSYIPQLEAAVEC